MKSSVQCCSKESLTSAVTSWVLLLSINYNAVDNFFCIGEKSNELMTMEK